MSNSNIVLIGFMGTGKSSIGKELSILLSRQFLDTDAVIEHNNKSSISDIIQKIGIDNFRILETDIIRKICAMENLVIATGGGVPTVDDNMKLLKQNSVIICLSSSIDQIDERVKPYSTRPLLSQSDNPKLKIKQLLEEREKYYSKADFYINTDSLSPRDSALKIIELLEQE